MTYVMQGMTESFFLIAVSVARTSVKNKKKRVKAIHEPERELLSDIKVRVEKCNIYLKVQKQKKKTGEKFLSITSLVD